MPRALSTLAIQQFFAENMDECLFVLFKIDHADFATPYFMVNNNEPVISNGDTYDTYPINALMPNDDSDSVQKTTTLTIDTVDRTMLNILRALKTPATVEISLVLETQLDTVILGPFISKLKSLPYNKTTMTGTLVVRDVLTTLFPKGIFGVTEYPNLWRN